LKSQVWEVETYQSPDGVSPFDEWLDNLKDRRGRSRLLSRLERLPMGNLGDHKFIAEGVSELRLQFGPGYRVYFARSGHQLILLLCGGDKASQAEDIAAAIGYWQEYRSRCDEFPKNN
jgi:putative addiction module killer protein